MAKKFKMLAYSGAVVETAWLGRVIFDLAGFKLSPPLPALREHVRFRPAGIIDKAERGTDILTVLGTFVSTHDGQEVESLISQGFPMQSSIGVFMETLEEVKAGDSAPVNGSRFTGPGFVVRSSTIREISFVALGADAGTKVESLAASLPGGLTMGLSEQFFKELSGEASPENAADLEISQLAEDLAKREGISLDLAIQRIFTERPDLAQAWLANVENSIAG